jgi:hypothetical protein
MKNWLISKTAVPLLNKYIAEHGYVGIGKVEGIQISGKDKTITVGLMLQGEVTTVIVTLYGFSLEKNDRQYYLHWSSIKASRLWLENAAKKFLPNSIQLPWLVGKVLAKLA